ncbi:MAG: GNAT family N-acetyltransferase [Clostridia bacterium]|nr:GNAT family N-acetyltransferase [Clostridia bacterium]MBQ8971611.1 GNAT family N-acetyltransferase [Clostridia bacterium]
MGEIRRAENRDIPDVLKLLVQVNMVHHNGRPDLFKGPATKYSEGELRQIFLNDATPVFVLTDEAQRVLGYAFCILQQHVGSQLMTDIKTLYIDDLCVDEACRGQHIGSRLYQYVLEYARSIGCYNVTLNVWSCNESAMRFYEHCGLKPQKVGMETIL